MNTPPFSLRASEFIVNPSSTESLMAKLDNAFRSKYADSRWGSAREIIFSDKDSADFIRWILKDEDYHEIENGSPMYEFAKGRARHSVITFLVGLLFTNSFGLFKSIDNAFGNMNDPEAAVRLWMLTALYHDWAYHSADIVKPDFDYRKNTSYYLFDDDYGSMPDSLCVLNGFAGIHYAALAYTYDEIEAYDDYARNKLHPIYADDKERLDHGILGGVKIFDRLTKRIVKSLGTNTKIKDTGFERELFAAKTSCLTIAQHNIFKSEDASHDKLYGASLKKLHSYSPFVIDVSTPLLLLLSLVDTFECVKRFGKTKNERDYLQTETVLSRITVSVESDSVTADYTMLAKYIDSHKDAALMRCLDDYIAALCKIDKWTAFSAEKKGAHTVFISLRASKSNGN